MKTQTHVYNADLFDLSLYQADPGELTAEYPGVLVVSQFADNDVLRQIGNGKVFHHKYKKGNVTLIPPSTKIWVKWSKPCEFMILSLKRNYVVLSAKLPVIVENLSILYHHSLRDPVIAQLCLALKNTLTDEAIRSDQYVSSLVLVLSTHLAIHYAQGASACPQPYPHELEVRLESALQFIHNSLSTKITWEEIATSARISPYHFSRLFKARTGLSPRQYIIEARLEKAKKLLLSTKQTINDIAELTGFNNASHLGSTFNKHFGMTPTQYRRR